MMNNEKSQDSSKKMTRRQFLQTSVSTVIGAGLLTSGYAWLWEPKQLAIETVQLHFNTLPSAFDGLKVVQFSDVHLGFHFDDKRMKKLVKAISSQSPDIICFTGDIVDRDSESLVGAMSDLSSLHAPLGKYAVLGNHDHWGQPAEVRRMLQECGFTVLQNSHVIVRKQDSMFAIVGLEDQLHGNPDPKKALEGITEGTFSLLLIHEPDYADTAALYPFDMQLSGHSHGGQVRLPFFGAIITPMGSRRYIQGLYKLKSSGMQLYVNRGVGVTQLPIRFLCRPELTVFTLNKSGE
ncbi:metallophosphoesterase [Paenibacillus sp. FA6]|uniref:metallophosphoesterase n=1 Tax=Paenibacillus sp. FA6 TaxID=3413029 RepID=UPI003F65EBB9